nr:MAG TPA: hypothetical protein [Caudoviricetes sp.]
MNRLYLSYILAILNSFHTVFIKVVHIIHELRC